MRIYYRAHGEDGKVYQGEVDAPSRVVALKKLAQQGWHIDYCDERPPAQQAEKRERRGAAPAARERAVVFPDLLVMRPWPGHLSNFYHQLGQLLGSGISPHEAAVALAERAPTFRLRVAMAELAPQLAAGGSLAEGLARYPQLFPPEAAGLLRAAERSGDWVGICGELEQWYTRLHRGLIWVAIERSYYTVVLLSAILTPSLALIADPKGLAAGLHAYLHHAATVSLPIIGGLVLFWLAWRVVWGLPGMRPVRDRLMLMLPLARGYEMRAAGLRLFRAMHSLLHAGIDTGEALNLAADATGNSILAQKVRAAAEAVQQGAQVEDVAMGLPFLSREERGTLATAFQSGRLDEGLARLADEARDKMNAKLWTTRLALMGTIMAVVTVIAALAIIIAVLNIYRRGFAMAGVNLGVPHILPRFLR